MCEPLETSKCEKHGKSYSRTEKNLSNFIRINKESKELLRMKERMKKLLFELLKDSKRSDRELAKVLGVSQPTVTRMRSRLAQEGVIKEYTIIPDFIKMGYEIMAITTVRAKTKRELTEKGKKSVMARPNIIFATRAKGMGKNGLFISLHKNYLDFDNFLTEYFQEWGDDIEEHETVLISLGGLVVKPLSLKYLAEVEEK